MKEIWINIKDYEGLYQISNLGNVKSLYFAYLTMERYNLFRRPVLDSLKQKYDKNQLIRSIVPAERMIKRRQQEGLRVEKEKRAEAKKQKEPPKINHPTKITGTTKVTPVKKAGNIVKSTKTTKRK